jgi:uncharacterized protein (TIGR03067 family)
MKTRVATLLAVCLLAATPREDKKAEVKLEGIWAIKKLSTRGREAPSLPEEAVVEFTKDFMTMKVMGPEIKLGTYAINIDKKPAELDIVRQEGEQKGKTVKAIFSLEGDALKICLAEAPSGPRPTDFKVKEGERFVYMELKREKK